MNRMTAVLSIFLAGLLVWTAGCRDSSGLKQVTPDSLPSLPGLILSAPVRPLSAAAGRVGAAALGVLASTSVVYVSLAPGSVPTGLQATIRDQATGVFVTTAVVGGGFDPIAIAASVGDTLVLEIKLAGLAQPLRAVQLVMASRPPVVVRTSPPRGGRDVPLNSIMVIVFSTPIDPATLTTGTVQLWLDTTPVAGTVRFADALQLRVEVHPDSLLAAQTDYRLVVTQAIRDVNGVPLAATVTATFTTAASAPTTGNLQVTISGLPVFATGAVTVSGPAGYSQTVTASTTLSDLVPGTYAIAALNVVVSSATYGPAPASQTVPVTASTTPATATVTYTLLPIGWASKAAMPTARSGLAVGVVNGVLYAVGGTDSSGYISTVEAYDPATNSWTTKAAMPTARGYLGGGVVTGVLYAVGGNNLQGRQSTVEAYDPATNTWISKAAMLTARAGLAVGVVNGVLYAVGGVDAFSTYLNTVEAYDPATDTWTTKAAMSTARRGPAVGVVNGVLYAVGGAGVSGVLNSVEAYDPATNTWTAKAALPTARWHLATDVVNGVLYAVGGVDSAGNHVNIVEAYDPATNTWTTKAAMPTARSVLAAGVVNGVLYAVGGLLPIGYSSALEAYTP